MDLLGLLAIAVRVHIGSYIRILPEIRIAAIRYSPTETSYIAFLFTPCTHKVPLHILCTT